jgi:hypothetical protein
MKNNSLKFQWMHALKMGKELPKFFKICSEHFEERHILSRTNPGLIQKKYFLAKKAFSVKKLPESSVPKRIAGPRRILNRKRPSDQVFE